MARHFGKMLCTLWSDEDFLALSADAKVLFSAFFSQPDITPAGILPWTERRWRRWLNGDAERASAAFDELVVARYVIADEDTSEVWLRSFITHDGRLSNMKLAASVTIAVSQIRSTAIARALEGEYPNIFPRRRAIDGQSAYIPRSQEGPSVESGWDPDVTQRNGEEKTVIRDELSDCPRLERETRMMLLKEAGAPERLLRVANSTGEPA
jgi:hypothetical protein